jgi:hypothetical protein
MLTNLMDRRLLRILMQAVLIVMATCILSIPANAAAAEALVPLPAYRRGATFIYADGTWETVVNTTADEVVWKNHLGFLSNGSPDFTRLRTHWESASRRGIRAFSPREDLFLKSETSVWPLKTGRSAHFKETGAWSEKEGPEHAYSALWSCNVAGRQTVSVPAGSFDTWEIECSRFSLIGYRNSSLLWETLRWYYAPAVGHYVLVVSKHVDDPEPWRQELLAVLPPAEDLPSDALRCMEENLQQTLESNPSGKPLGWSSPTAKVSGQTTPFGTFRGLDGTFCRRYVQNINEPEGKRDYYGMACRTSEGKWEVFRK